MEVAAWEAKQDGVSLSLERPGLAQGEVDLRLPSHPKAAWINGKPIAWQTLEEGVFRFEVRFEKSAEIKVEY
jgi:hypothetical protein